MPKNMKKMGEHSHHKFGVYYLSLSTSSVMQQKYVVTDMLINPFEAVCFLDLIGIFSYTEAMLNNHSLIWGASVLCRPADLSSNTDITWIELDLKEGVQA